MPNCVVVVESPAKAKTLQKYLGSKYTVLASYGHVRDLPPKQGSVDPDHAFAMTYTPIDRNKRHVDAIARALKNADTFMLATDPDREGEAIAWHLYEMMVHKKILKDVAVQRIVFHEITKSAILQAMEHPRDIAMPLVQAQQARRALDYLVGFNLSPLLWKKVRRNLSAGRVQSPALRMIVEREEEIEAFVRREYWKITAQCHHAGVLFDARLVQYQGKKCEQFTIVDEKTALEVRDLLIKDTQGSLKVGSIEKKERKRKPAAPFTTSTLQQEAARKLGFSAKKTMMTAQQLYEGIETSIGTVGLITYMRTDSVALSGEAISEMRHFIETQYSKPYLPKEPRIYKTKSKNAQEAHEAIRPTSITRTPESLKSALNADQYKLYQLIFKRTLASQMSDAIIDTVRVDLETPKQDIFRANGSTIRFDGFLVVYEEGKDDTLAEDGDNKTLPQFTLQESVDVQDIVPSQHFTEPPPRYSEASLIKALEEHDIGRPSTYATIIHTLQQREYVILENKRFLPTDIGRVVSHFLTKYFARYVDYAFTAQLENTLDALARGETELLPVLENFWQPFITEIHRIDSEVKRQDVTSEVLSDLCPKCGKPLSIRLGKRGRFIGCTGYPDCDYTANLEGDVQQPKPEAVILEDRPCPECSHPLQIRTGRYGNFIGCSNYPACKHIEPLEKPKDTGVTCPICKKNALLEKKSRKGKIFYACSGYPKCKYALWNRPITGPCPKCDWPILTIKETKREGETTLCPQESCGYHHK